jgi:hypothetical protein
MPLNTWLPYLIKEMKVLQRICLAISAIAFMVLLAGIALSNKAFWEPAAVWLVVSFAIGIGAISALKKIISIQPGSS